MSKPTILTVVDDPQVSAAITRDLPCDPFYGAAHPSAVVLPSQAPATWSAIAGLV